MSNKTNPESNFKIGLLLQEARELKGVTQKDMSTFTGLSKNHISAIERGISKASVDLLLEYCKALDMDPNEVLKYKQ